MSTHRHHSLARSAGIFTGATTLSRILGYIRDSLIAKYFGAAATDAFFTAFRMSNLLRRLLAEGTLSASFIPVFTEYTSKHGKEKAQEFLNVMFTTWVVLLAIVTGLGMLGAPWLIRLIAPGFESTPDRFALTVSLTRIMFPFLFFVSLAAVVAGVLNALDSFFLPALAPACLSVTEIVYIFAWRPFLSPANRIIGLAMAVTIGGFGQFFIHVPALWKKMYHLHWDWNWRHSGMRRVGKLILPATIGISADQLNTFVDTICASLLTEGSVTALHFASRIMQLPLALFGIALSQVALPSMSASVARGAPEEVRDTLNFALRLGLFMILPATTGLIVLSHPIVQILLQHGQFTPEATDRTAQALLFFASGILGYASVKILAGAFYAHQDTRGPVAIAIACVVLNVVLNIVFIKFTALGVGGLALATSIASWMNAALLFGMLQRKIGVLGAGRLFRTFWKSSIGCGGMTLFCRWVFLHGERVALLIRLGIAIVGGILIYMAIARLVRMEEWDPFWAQVYRRQKTPPPIDV